MLANAPLLRIVIPYIAGILFTSIYTIHLLAAFIAVGAIIILAFIVSHKCSCSPLLSVKIVPALTALVMIVAFIAGWQAGSSAVAQQVDISALNGKTLIARIDNINNKNFSMSLEATVLSCASDHSLLQNTLPISITIRGNDYLLHEGEIISFNASLKPIASLGNPYEFDYALFMKRKGIQYSQLLRLNDYNKLGERNTILTWARTSQRTIANAIINSGMNPNTQRFLCTILLGETAYLDPEMRAYFSQAGISHILALSGLHMGIIASIVLLLLKPLSYIGLFRTRFIIVIPVLLIYLFITGLSPSATRSAVMMIFVLLANLSYRRNSSLNALFASAIIILTVSPNSIYDAGFQLSFAAVLAILLFYEKLIVFSPNNKVMRYLFSSLSLTTVATIGTIIISAYYFHVIPLMSIVSNMIVLPFLPFYLSIGLLHTTLLCFGVEIPEFSIILDWATSAIDYIAATISNLPYSSISQVNISAVSLLCYGILYFSFTAWIFTKRFYYAICSLTSVLVIAITGMIEFASLPRSGIVFLNSYSSTPIMHFSQDSCKIWCVDDSVDINAFTRNNIGFFSHYGFSEVEVTNGFSSYDNFINSPWAYLEGKRIAVISNTATRHLHSQEPINIDYLVIASSYYGRIADLLDTFSPECIVLSGGIYDDKREQYKKEMERIHIPFHDLRTDGAIFIYSK